MSKCPNCNVDMKEIDGQIYLCPKCGGKFRKKQPTSQVPPTGLASTAPQVSQTACSQNMNEESNAATKQQAVGADKENGSKDDEIELLKQRLAAMEAQQRQLADKIGPEHTTGKAIEKVKNFLSGEKFAPVLSFFKKWGVKAVLPSVLVFIAFITLCVCFIGVRGTYVNVNDPNEFYSFTS
ncbi:MAG: zf-TFIIB domain-containing protein, partial [Clostridia bacterium]